MKEISEKLPVNKEQLLSIKGCGREKVSLYGDVVCQLVLDYMKEKGIEGNFEHKETIKEERLLQNKEDKIKSHMVTYNLYNSGMSLEEISSERGLTLLTVENHIFQCYEEGLDINLDDLIPKYENIILEAIERVDHKGKLKPIKEALPSNIEYSAIKAVLYKHKSAS